MDGGKGSGKSTMACRIYEVILNDVSKSEIIFTPNHPESKEVNLIAVRSLKQVFSLLDLRPYQVLLIDDASRYNENLLKEVLQNFNELRHRYEELTGEGEIILFLMVQDVFQLAKILRKDISGFIFKDCPQDESDQDYINRQTCYKGRLLLATWTSKVKDDKILSFLSHAIVSTESWAGYMSINMSKDPRFRPYSKIANPQGIRFIEPEEGEDIQFIHEWSKLDLFEWHEPLHKILSKSTKWSKYAKAWKYLIINDLPVDELKTEKLTGMKSTVNRQMRNALLGRTRNNGQTKEKVHPVYSWIKHIRGEKLFEHFVIDVCRKIEIEIKPKPQIKVKLEGSPPKIYTDDLQICCPTSPTEDLKSNIIVNLKVGKGKNSYTWDEHYKTTFYATKMGYQAVLLYYDLETDLVLIFDEEISLQHNIVVSGEKAKFSGIPLTKALESLRERLIPPSPPNSPPSHVSAAQTSALILSGEDSVSVSTEDSTKGKGVFGAGDKTVLENKEIQEEEND